MNLIKYITPINLKEEKDKFFNSNSYNPQFKYNWNSKEAIGWAKKQTKYKKLISSLVSQESKEITKHANELFSTQIDKELLYKAKKILSKKPVKFDKQHLSEIRTSFDNVFKFFDLIHWTIKLTDKQGFNFRPSYKDKTIYASKHLNLEYFSINGEVKHELTHVIRYENGLSNKIKRSADYLPTEEGLATYMQDYAGENGEASAFQHAAEYCVTEIGLKGSLRNMTNYLVGLGFSAELAFQRAVRHKFGFKDTSKPGDIMKPSMYFYNQQKVSKLRNDDIYRLFVGKISLEELSNYERYSGIVPLGKLKSFYNI